jgi:hypothetical protein
MRRSCAISVAATVGVSATRVPPDVAPAVKYKLNSGPEAASAVALKALSVRLPLGTLAGFEVSINPLLGATRIESKVSWLAPHVTPAWSDARFSAPALVRSADTGRANLALGATSTRTESLTFRVMVCAPSGTENAEIHSATKTAPSRRTATREDGDGDFDVASDEHGSKDIKQQIIACSRQNSV